MGVCAHADVLPEAFAVQGWTEKHDRWCKTLPALLVAVWRQTVPCALRLLAAVDGFGDLLDAAGHLLQSLNAILELRLKVSCQHKELKKTFEMLQQVTAPGAEVALSIYQLHGTSTLTAVTELAGLGGVYHVGVEVYWLEWSFGYCDSGSGVFVGHIGQSSLGDLRERVPLGQTPCTPSEAVIVLSELRRQWTGPSYDILKQNCATFGAVLVQRLRVGDAPEWVN